MQGTGVRLAKPSAHARSRSGRRLAMSAMLALAVLAAGGCYLYLRAPRPSAPPIAPRSILVSAARSAGGSPTSATFTTQIGGLTVLFGTIRGQLRPAPMADLMMTTVDGADRFSMQEIVTGSYVYLQVPGLAPEVGKPWFGVPVPQLTADPALAELYQANAIPAGAAGLLAAATTARAAGSARVHGVLTRRYVGTVDPAAALPTLSPTVRQLVAPGLKSASGAIRFVAWVDGRRTFREIQTSATIGGRSTVTTIVFTATTRAAPISVPAASQVAMTPPGSLPTG